MVLGGVFHKRDSHSRPNDCWINHQRETGMVQEDEDLRRSVGGDVFEEEMQNDQDEEGRKGGP